MTFEFGPHNKVVRYCLEGMGLEDQGEIDQAIKSYKTAWEEATNDFEKYLAAFFFARIQTNLDEKIKWFKTALEYALKVDDIAVISAFSTLYLRIAQCYEALSSMSEAEKYFNLSKAHEKIPKDPGPFYHGTKAELSIGDYLEAGRTSNYTPGLKMNHIYFTGLKNGAGLAASMAKGQGRERVYIVETTGPYENDPNVTDKKFPGNPTRSYRTSHPLKIIGILEVWPGQTPDEVDQWRKKIDESKGQIIN